MRPITKFIVLDLALVGLGCSAIGQTIDDMPGLWSKVVLDWKSLCRDLDYQEYTFRSSDEIDGDDWMQVTVSFQGNRRKLEVRGDDSKVILAAGDNPDYDFGLDTMDNDPTSGLFIADLHAAGEPKTDDQDGMWESQSGFFARYPYCVTLFRGGKFRSHVESAQVEKAFQLESGNIRIQGTMISDDDTTFTFDIEVVPQRRHAITDCVLKFPR